MQYCSCFCTAVLTWKKPLLEGIPVKLLVIMCECSMQTKLMSGIKLWRIMIKAALLYYGNIAGRSLLRSQCCDQSGTIASTTRRNSLVDVY